MINHPFLRVTGLSLQCVFVLTVYLNVSQPLRQNTRRPKSIVVTCVLTYVWCWTVMPIQIARRWLYVFTSNVHPASIFSIVFFRYLFLYCSCILWHLPFKYPVSQGCACIPMFALYECTTTIEFFCIARLSHSSLHVMLAMSVCCASNCFTSRRT